MPWQQMPIDAALLEPLGTVTWAAVRLHAYVRDAIDDIRRRPPSMVPYGQSLGVVVSELRTLAPRVTSPQREALLAWCEDAMKIVGQRNEVMHAIPSTSDDGQNTLLSNKTMTPHTAESLLAVADELVRVQLTLPPRPFTVA